MTKDKTNLLDPEDLEKLEKPARKPKEFMLSKLSLKFDKTLKSDFIVDSEEKAIYLVNDYLADSPNECLMAIALDSDKQPIGACVLGVGSEHHVDSNYGNLFKFIFTSNADSFFLVHNHPSSKELKPSQADLQTFEDLSNIGSKLGVRFRDFIITGNENQNRAYYSWSKGGIITQYDFIQNIKNAKIKPPFEIKDTSNSERTIDEVNELLAESEYNSEESLKSSTKEKSSNSIFNIFMK